MTHISLEQFALDCLLAVRRDGQIGHIHFSHDDSRESGQYLDKWPMRASRTDMRAEVARDWTNYRRWAVVSDSRENGKKVALVEAYDRETAESVRVTRRYVQTLGFGAKQIRGKSEVHGAAEPIVQAKA